MYLVQVVPWFASPTAGCNWIEFFFSDDGWDVFEPMGVVLFYLGFSGVTTRRTHYDSVGRYRSSQGRSVVSLNSAGETSCVCCISIADRSYEYSSVPSPSYPLP